VAVDGCLDLLGVDLVAADIDDAAPAADEAIPLARRSTMSSVSTKPSRSRNGWAVRPT
jgi:hypothetical protein